MPIEVPKDTWPGQVRSVTLGATADQGGSRTRAVTVGGEKTLPFMHFEAEMPNAPVIAVELGGGPAIKVKDSGMIAHAGLVRQMRSGAEEAEIPYQLEVLERGTTDARSMQIAGAGCAAGCVSIPCRYAHSQSETVAIADVANSVKLLVEILSKPIEL